MIQRFGEKKNEMVKLLREDCFVKILFVGKIAVCMYFESLFRFIVCVDMHTQRIFLNCTKLCMYSEIIFAVR